MPTMCRAISLMARTPVPSTPVSAWASGRLGVTTAAKGNSRVRSVRIASGRRRTWPPLATITGSTTRRWIAVLLNLVGHGADDAGVGKHAGLDRIGADVFHDGIDLGGDHGRRRFEDPRHAGGVLGSDGGDR